MAWTSTSKGKNSAYGVYSEEITSKQGAITWSSEIDFIPPGHDFTVICNSAATNLSASTHVELFVAYDASAAVANRYRRTVEGFTPTSAAIDAATTTHHYDASASGQFPYYYFKLPTGGGSVTMKVMVGDKITQVQI